ncbi:MAG: Type and secretion system protein [Chthoniobacteraceae bacterium]|nr:Type and secretion system protein [Chthoniobacteraceae bacterium]
MHDFQGDDIGIVLRSLARQAGLTMIVSDKVTQPPGMTVTARIENKTPLEAIEIIVESKGLVMEEKKGVVTVKTMEEKQKEPAISGSYTLSYGQAKDILPLLGSQLVSGLPPQFDLRTNTVYFRETKSNMAKIMEFLLKIDQPTMQVMIEARLVEVNANPKQSYGINWGGIVGGASNPQTIRYGGSNPAEPPTYVLDSSGNPRATPGKPSTGVINELAGTLSSRDFFLDGHTGGNFLSAIGGQFAILSLPQLSATLRLLNEDSDAEFLANPRVVTANNLKAKIQITRNQPVPQLNFNEQTAQAVFSGFQDKEFGNTLEVTPVINKDDFVTLSVKPEISNKIADQSFTFGGATVTSPVIDKRTLDSNVVIKSGDTLAIGGLLQDEVRKGRSKVPVLGDIPLIGYVFQEKLSERVKRNLLIFVTPTIIKQGYGTGLEDQVSGIHHSGEEFADPNGWRNNAKGAYRLIPSSNRQVAADIPKPGVAPAPASKRSRTVKTSTVKVSTEVVR